MKITIVGGGNIGTQFAVHCAEKGHEVTVYTSQPEIFSRELYISNEEGIITHQGNIKCATHDPDTAFKFAEIIIITMPAMMMKSIAELIFNHASSDAIIGVVPGNGGSECAFKQCILRGNTFFGIERVPAIARLIQKGKNVKSTGYRNELHIASFPKDSGKAIAELLSGIFDMRTTIIPNYLNLTMTPSNPVLHTTRLFRLFHDWHEGIRYDSVPLFYEDWDDQSSELLFLCDEEVQRICDALPEFELSYVKSLKVHYESPTIGMMTRKISSIPAFKGIRTPMVVEKNGYIPDLHSRYFTADFSYGLSVIQQIAAFAGVNTPTINCLMEWYRKIAIEKEEFCYNEYGIDNICKIRDFYLR